MDINMDNICRTCMFTRDLKPIEDSFSIEILRKITGINYKENDDLPKKICGICINKIKDIHIFALQCKKNESCLKEYVTKYKVACLTNDTLNENDESIVIKEEVTTHEVNDIYIMEDIKEETDPLKNTEEGFYVKSEINLNEEIELDGQNIVCNSHEINNIDNKETEKEYICGICSKEFTQAYSLAAHQIVHNGPRPFKCEICSKTFPTKTGLKIHNHTHMGNRSYKCDACAKTFSDSCVLLVHKRLHTGERPFTCVTCGKRFADSSSLKRHSRAHTCERPYKCAVCAKTFMQLYELKSHHACKHSDERPFRCATCGKMFKQKHALRKHEKTHEKHDGERLHDCETCGKVFKNPQGLTKHLRDHSVSIKNE